MRKSMMQMNVLLHHLFTEITGVTGLRIMRDVVAGVHAPATLAVSRLADMRKAYAMPTSGADLRTCESRLAGNSDDDAVTALRTIATGAP
jgi:hypothetical protein